MGRVTARRRVLRIRDRACEYRPDTLVVEEPMEIRVAGRSLTVTMRTPGHDFDLAMGFLVSEGIIRGPEDVLDVRYCAGASADEGNTYNLVDVRLAAHVAAPDPSLQRSFYTTSSCGLCGKSSLDAVHATTTWSLTGDTATTTAEVLTGLPERLRGAQRVFDSTGGLHGAGLFGYDGSLRFLHEDVGRHNAVDKVVGHALREGLLPARESILMVSGRASFELVQKALMAGIPVLAAVSAPSSLAADLARDHGLTLVGFLRGPSMNVYSGAERVRLPAPGGVR